MRARPRPLLLLLALLLIGSTIAAASAHAATDTLGWPQFGRTARHLNTNPDEQAFSPANATRLRVAWKDHYGDNSTSESGPVVSGGLAYIAGTDGNLSAFPAAGCGAASCEPLWHGRPGRRRRLRLRRPRLWRGGCLPATVADPARARPVLSGVVDRRHRRPGHARVKRQHRWPQQPVRAERRAL